MKSLVPVLFLILLASQSSTEQNNGGGYQFAADVESLLIGPLVKDFSCQGRNYGYYADVSNNCQIFHICWPVETPNQEEEKVVYQWSFVCGNQTIFDQATLTCNHFSAALPCEAAPSLYNDVEYFTKT